MKQKITREQADRLHQECIDHALKFGFPIKENKKITKKSKQTSNKVGIKYK